MDFKATAKKITTHLVPYFDTSKSINQIGANIKSTQQPETILVWDIVKDKFIEEYQADVPIPADFDEDDLVVFIKSKLKKLDDTLTEKLEAA